MTNLPLNSKLNLSDLNETEQETPTQSPENDGPSKDEGEFTNRESTETQEECIQNIALQENEILDGLVKGFMIGVPLKQIRDSDGYLSRVDAGQDVPKNVIWKQYLKEKFSISVSYATLCIKAAECYNKLKESVAKHGKSIEMPVSEGVLREIRKAPEEKWLELWENALERSGNNRPTAAQVAECRKQMDLNDPPKQTTETAKARKPRTVGLSEVEKYLADAQAKLRSKILGFGLERDKRVLVFKALAEVNAEVLSKLTKQPSPHGDKTTEKTKTQNTEVGTDRENAAKPAPAAAPSNSDVKRKNSEAQKASVKT